MYVFFHYTLIIRQTFGEKEDICKKDIAGQGHGA